MDDSDVQFREALAYAHQDPHLAPWLREQTKCYDTIRAKLADYARKTVTIKGTQTVRDGFPQPQVDEIRKL